MDRIKELVLKIETITECLYKGINFNENIKEYLAEQIEILKNYVDLEIAQKPNKY